MMKTSVCIAIFLLALLAMPHVVGAGKNGHLVFGVPEQMLYGDKSRQILRRAYLSLGYSLEFKPTPMLCFLTETNAGRLDGEICRMQRLSSQYPNLALVRMPLCSVQLVAVAARPLLLSGWEDFAALRVAHRRGVVGLRTLLPFGTSVMLAPDPNKVLDLVTGGRVDVALLARAALEPRIRASQYAHLRVISLPFGRIDLYHYLHKCHADLVPRVESALHEFVAE